MVSFRKEADTIFSTKSDLEIIELKYRFGLSINEIAIKFSLNNESAKKRHQRAIAKLRKDLK